MSVLSGAKPPILYAVIALDAYGEQVWNRVHNHEEEALAARDRLSRDLYARKITHSKITTFHVAVFRGEWVER